MSKTNSIAKFCLNSEALKKYGELTIAHKDEIVQNAQNAQDRELKLNNFKDIEKINNAKEDDERDL